MVEFHELKRVNQIKRAFLQTVCLLHHSVAYLRTMQLKVEKIKLSERTSSDSVFYHVFVKNLHTNFIAGT